MRNYIATSIESESFDMDENGGNINIITTEALDLDWLIDFPFIDTPIWDGIIQFPDGFFGINGTDASESLDGNSWGESITANGGDDNVDGGDGNDTVYGGTGNDQLFGNFGNDSLYGDEGNDRIEGYAGDDLLFGGAGNDELYGNSGSDNLDGGTGSDRLDGFSIGLDDFSLEPQYDTLTGGEGADTFVLGNTFGAFYLGEDYATITDFDWGQGDKIQVFGNIENYSVTVQGAGVDIAYQGDLIARVTNTTDVIPFFDFIVA